MEVLLDMLNKSSKRRKKMMIDLDELVPSKDNEVYPMNGIVELADSMLYNGQEQPLIVFKNEKGEYTILSGERRYRAAKLLVEKGHEEFSELECIVDESDLSELEQRMKIRICNHHRDLIPVENKLKIVEQCMNDYDLAKESGLIDRGVRKREWISQQTGFSERSIQEYMNKIMGIEEEKQPKKEKEIDPFSLKIEETMKEKLQTKVVVQPKKIMISFNTKEELKHILELLNIEVEEE